MSSSMPYNNGGEYQRKQSPVASSPGYFDGLPPISPTPQQPAFMDFGGPGSGPVGSNDLSQTFSPTAPRSAAGAPRRGRLFELIDDGEDNEHLNDADVVSGMLGNLNVDLFQNNASQDVDIEAISLMGIGGPPSRQHQLPPGNSHPSRSRYA